MARVASFVPIGVGAAVFWGCAGLSGVGSDQRMSRRTNGWEHLIRLSVSYPLAALAAAGGRAMNLCC